MMNTTRIHLFVGLLALVLVGQGCPSPTPSPAPAPVVETPIVQNEPKATPQTETASTYAPFTKEAYDSARAAGKPILLFFYAKWCPYCIEQDPRFEKIIPTHNGGVVAFRVNFNDTDTDADEKALAKEFGVAYQHTHFFIGRDGTTKKKAIGKITDEQTVEYLNLISN